MFDPCYYGVVTFNQASGQPEDDVRLHRSLRDAVEDRDGLEAENRADGRREGFRVYRLEEVDEDELHEWGTRPAGSDIAPMIYVNGFAARRAMPEGHELLKRRLGTTEWTVVDPTTEGV